MTNIIYYIQNFTNEYLEISFWVLVGTTSLLMTFWMINRKKIQNLSHQIPASVVKNYLDSIIQNSTALKSSLFRGGGLDIGGGVPSVMPIGQLPTSSSVQMSSGSSEELSQKSAEISVLKSKLLEKENLLKELEKSLDELQAGQANGDDGSQEIIKNLNSKVKELESKIAKLQLVASSTTPSQAHSSGDSEDLTNKLNEVTAERDILKEKLMEYEIIEEDLANLKRLQKENEQLKLTIKQFQGNGDDLEIAEDELSPNPVSTDLESVEVSAEVEAEVEEVISEAEEPTEQVESSVTEEEVTVEAKEESTAIDDLENVAELPKKVGASKETASSDQKSAEELLSEFEKMLG